MLAIKPAETPRLRDARSLLGFALFAPFAAFLLDQGPLTLVLGLVAVAARAGRAAAPGRRGVRRRAHRRRRCGASAGVRPAARDRPAAGAGARSGCSRAWARRCGACPNARMARPGLSDRMTPGEWLDLLADDTPALRVQFFGATPPTQQMYWRGPVLWDFDGRTWTQPRWLRGIAAGAVRPARRAGTTSSNSSRPTAASWSRSTCRWPRPTARGCRWTTACTARAPLSRADALAHAVGAAGALRSRRCGHAARSWPWRCPPATTRAPSRWPAVARARPATTTRAIVAARAGLDPPRLRLHPGHAAAGPRRAWTNSCSTARTASASTSARAFVVLMRAAGIPTRVVTGYVGGDRNPLGDYWMVRRMDAHAWTEVWLPGRGWVRVDPTAAVAPERIYDTARRPPARRRRRCWRARRCSARGSTLGDWLRRGWNDLVLGFDADRQRACCSRSACADLRSGAAWRCCSRRRASLALAWMVWLLPRGDRERDPVLRAWHRAGCALRATGLGREPHEPARRMGRAAWPRPAGTERDGLRDSAAVSPTGATLRASRGRRRRAQPGPRPAPPPAVLNPALDDLADPETVMNRSPSPRRLAASCWRPAPRTQARCRASSPRSRRATRSTRDSTGAVVRWGGRIVAGRAAAEPHLLPDDLDAPRRHRSAATGRRDDVGGRFIACRTGFYDPAVFEKNREVTFIGRVDGYENRRIGEYDYRLPK